MDLYIYYRVPAAHTMQLHGKIKALHAVLQGRFGIAAGLKRRPGEQDGRQTWMEVYEHIAPTQEQDFQHALERALDEAGIADLIEGARHIERFEDVAPCA